MSTTETREEREERMSGLVDARLRVSGIPPRWRGLTFDRLDEDEPRAEALRCVRGWAMGDVPGVCLWGGVGHGKTVIAAAGANMALHHGALRWLSVAELLMDLRMPFSSPEYVRAQRVLDPGRRRMALVLDDLDKAKPTEHALQPLYVAINGWIEARFPLIVTMNRSPDELAAWMGETFGEAIASRLAGYCDVIEVGGRDRRLS